MRRLARLHTMTDSAPRIRVLVAEDDDNARSLLIDLLATLGHTVVAEVSTGREAFERAKDVVPDVVLLDVHMPDGSGIEAAEAHHARRCPAWRSCCSAAITR